MSEEAPHLVFRDSPIDPFARLGIGRREPSTDEGIEPRRKVEIERFTDELTLVSLELDAQSCRSRSGERTRGKTP